MQKVNIPDGKMKLITTTAELNDFCKSLENDKFITVDLEFLREKTYYAKLCLIQVGSEKNDVIIDPLAEDINLQSFFDLMQNQNVVKVFHSGRQDIEILYNISGKIPQNIFDTQVAAMACGFGESISYENLVRFVCKAELDKTCRLTNWSKRPLDEKQLNYAICDVTYLKDIYLFLKKKLEHNKHEECCFEELKILSDENTYETDPKDAWKKIKHRSHNVRFLTLLRELAAWREERAKRKNLPRQNIVKDECLLNIASECPTTHEQLANIRNMRKDIVEGKLAVEILQVVENFKKLSAKDYVKLETEGGGNYCPGLLELMKLLLKLKSLETGIVARLIATEDDLKRLASFDDKQNPLLSGWRFDVFGKDALLLRDGKIAFGFDAKRKNVKITTL